MHPGMLARKTAPSSLKGPFCYWNCRPAELRALKRDSPPPPVTQGALPAGSLPAPLQLAGLLADEEELEVKVSIKVSHTGAHPCWCRKEVMDRHTAVRHSENVLQQHGPKQY